MGLPKGYRHSEETKMKIGISNSKALKGRHLSEEHIKRSSEGRKGLLRSEETKAKISKALTGIKRSDEVKKRMSESRQGIKLSEDHKRKIGEAQKGIPRSEETKRKISIGHQGKKLSEEHCRHISEVQKGKVISESTRIKIGNALRGRKGQKGNKAWLGKHLSEDHKKRVGEGSKRSWQNPEYIEKQRIAKQAHREKMKLMWQDPAYVKKQQQARHAKKNKPEQRLEILLNEILPGEYRFVGDFQFTIAGKCPDFVNVNGQHKAIELYGDYWHAGDNPIDRIALFKQWGWDTLIIWEKELENIEIVKHRVIEFTKIKIQKQLTLF